MIVIAHIMGMPVEELLLPLSSAMTAGMLLGLASLVRGVSKNGRSD